MGCVTVLVRVLGSSTRSTTCSPTWVVDTARASSEVARGVNATSAAVDGVRRAWARRGREEGEKGGKGEKRGDRFALERHAFGCVCGGVWALWSAVVLWDAWWIS